MGVTRKDILREIVQLTLSQPSKDRVTAIREGKSKDRVTTVREGKSKDRVTTVREGKNKEVAPSQVLLWDRDTRGAQRIHRGRPTNDGLHWSHLHLRRFKICLSPPYGRKIHQNYRFLGTHTVNTYDSSKDDNLRILIFRVSE